MYVSGEVYLLLRQPRDVEEALKYHNLSMGSRSPCILCRRFVFTQSVLFFAPQVIAT